MHSVPCKRFVMLKRRRTYSIGRTPRRHIHLFAGHLLVKIVIIMWLARSCIYDVAIIDWLLKCILSSGRFWLAEWMYTTNWLNSNKCWFKSQSGFECWEWKEPWRTLYQEYNKYYQLFIISGVVVWKNQLTLQYHCIHLKSIQQSFNTFRRRADILSANSVSTSFPLSESPVATT